MLVWKDIKEDGYPSKEDSNKRFILKRKNDYIIGWFNKSDLVWLNYEFYPLFNQYNITHYAVLNEPMLP